MKIYHTPVMVSEVVEALGVRPGGAYVDCTVGEGGHGLAVLDSGRPGLRLLGIDPDEEALGAARERLEGQGGRVTLVRGSYADLERIAGEQGFTPADGVLFDLGVSSLQLENAHRGFSFSRSGPLDMRFDTRQSVSALQVVNEYPENRLADEIHRLGEEWRARRIARAIVEARPIATTEELAKVVARVTRRGRGGLHPATRTFQALRLVVNRELENLQVGLDQAIAVLGAGGRLVVISYHSLEDRLVKTALRREATDCICPPGVIECVCGHRASVRLISRKVVRPSPEEVRSNPRSRSARLRVAERLALAAT